MVVLGRGGVSYERGAPVDRKPALHFFCPSLLTPRLAHDCISARVALQLVFLVEYPSRRVRMDEGRNRGKGMVYQVDTFGSR